MTNVSRRNLLKTVVSGANMAALPSVSWSQGAAPTKRKGNIRQSASRWCYQKIPLDQLCEYAVQLGLKGIDLLNPDEFEVPPRYGLVCSMGYAGGGEIASAMNRVENHARIEEGYLVRTIQKNIDWIAHFHTGGVPGRHELDATQEVQWDGVMRGIAAATFHGYVAHEFVPIHDPLTSLRQAVDLCDV